MSTSPDKKEKHIDISYIKAFIGGDQEAYEVIYNHYRHHVYYMGMQFFNHDQQKAKDLVQNTFLEVYKSIDKLKAPEAFYVWMSKIAYWQGCNMLRSLTKDALYYTEVTEEDDEDYRLIDHTQVDVIGDIQKDKAMAIVLNALDSMSEDKKIVGYLRYFEELSINEISEITGINSNTVGSHMRRIRDNLKQILKENGFSSSACLGVVLMPNLVAFYQQYILNDYPVNIVFNAPYHRGGSVAARTSLANFWKTKLCYTFVAASIVVPGVIITVPEIQTALRYAVNDYAQITSLSYNTKPTNQSLEMDVQLSNDNYEKILVNGVNNKRIHANGDYRIEVLSRGRVIDELTVSITNIDKDIPKVERELVEDTMIYFTLKDNLSGVDFNKIRIDGIDERLLQIDEKSKSIKVDYSSKKDFDIYIPDFAGNIMQIRVRNYVITAQNEGD